MRRFALLALCGCNQFYGLDATKPRDAAPDAHDREVRLSLVVGGATQTASEAMVVLAPATLAEPPRIALLDKPLEPARYLEDAPSGIVPYPIEYVTKLWRLEYTPAQDVPHEVQWSPADTAGHLVVPAVGRTERTSVPANTGYILSMKLPSNTLYSFTPETVIYTTGYWSRAASAVSTLTPKVDFSTASPMSGGPSAPSDAAGDVIVAVDYTLDGNCRVPNRAGAVQAAPLQNGMMTSLELAFETSSEQLIPVFDGESPFDAQARLTGLLGARTDDISGGKLIFARLAHTSLPFTTSFEGVPAPQHIPIVECPVLQGVPASPVFDLGGRLAFTKATYVFVSNDRVVSGVRLRSSIATIGRATTNSMYQATFDVAATRSIKLGDIDLADGADGAPIGTGDAVELALAFDSSPTLIIDYYEVTLYRLASTTLEPIRTYISPDPAITTIRFDRALLLPDAQYVLAVRTYRGRSGARGGDFATVQGPQAVATIFSRTFTR